MNFKNKIALKRNVYAVVLSVIFIAVVIGVTALSTVLAENYPLDIDLTTDKQHSISDDNFDYIKNVDKTINIYVTLTEDSYNCNTGTTDDIGYIAAAQKFVDYNSANVAYYTQTVELLKKYQSYNDNITVKFIDVYDAKTRDITDNFQDLSWSIGDILVEGKFVLDGKEVTRRTVVTFDDIYSLKDESGKADAITSNSMYMMYYGEYALYGQGWGYAVSENNIESAISSAIYKVTSPETPVFLVPTTVSDKDSVADALEDILEVNNMTVEYSELPLSVLLTTENHKKYSGIILSNCKADITETERQLIEDFLNNDGNKGKSLFYFAGTNTVKLKNLCGLLGDWGIGFGDGILYETDVNCHIATQPTKILMESAQTEYTEVSDKGGKYCLADNLVKMEQLWPSSVTATYTRETTVLLRTVSAGKTAIMPIDADKEWAPASDAYKDKFITAMLARDDASVNNSLVSSFVLAFASSDFISNEHRTKYSTGNLNVALDTFNEATGNADAAFSFVPKTITNETYTVKENEAKAVKWIFMLGVPVVILAVCAVVWIRRKRK